MEREKKKRKEKKRKRNPAIEGDNCSTTSCHLIILEMPATRAPAMPSVKKMVGCPGCNPPIFSVVTHTKRRDVHKMRPHHWTAFLQFVCVDYNGEEAGTDAGIPGWRFKLCSPRRVTQTPSTAKQTESNTNWMGFIRQLGARSTWMSSISGSSATLFPTYLSTEHRYAVPVIIVNIFLLAFLQILVHI